MSYPASFIIEPLTVKKTNVFSCYLRLSNLVDMSLLHIKVLHDRITKKIKFHNMHPICHWTMAPARTVSQMSLK